jgi:hypothetical protein
VARQLAALLLAAGGVFPAHAHESDVHYGLTRWLAQKAGYLDWQAHAIAMGDLRVDSGSMGTLALLPEYACFAKDGPVAREIQDRHFPSDTKVPADPKDRAVVPGSSAAREALARIFQSAKGNEAAYLGLLGAALHPLQESWARAGVPAAPTFGPIRCDARLGSVPPVRGNSGPHAADLTYVSAVATVAMAKATFEALTTYPPAKGEHRTAQEWSSLEPLVSAFAQARSKTAKREWFVQQGIADTDFLATTTLPDGAKPGSLRFEWQELPALAKASSLQYDAPSDAREFFDRFIVRWLGQEPIESVVAEFGKRDASRTKAGAGASSSAAQMTVRLKLWKLRDHGAAAGLAHLARPLTGAEIAQANALGKEPSSYVAELPERELFPLMMHTPTPSPLLPYILHNLPGQGAAASRAIAVLRLKHAPRDTIGFVAENSPQGWTLVDVVSVVDQ